MLQSPSWAADWLAASQESPRISRNPKVHHRTHKRTPPVPILGVKYLLSSFINHFLDAVVFLTDTYTCCLYTHNGDGLF